MDQNLAYDDIEHEQPFLKIIAKIISYVLHPLFIPTYVFIWSAWRFPETFSGITSAGMMFKKISVFLNASFFPAFAVFLLWRLKFIESIYLRTQKDRIIPYIITMIFYLGLKGVLIRWKSFCFTNNFITSICRPIKTDH